MTEDAVVFVVEDDAAERSSLEGLVSTIGLKAKVFKDAQSFLSCYDDTAGCLVLDVRMPGMSGVELFDTLRGKGIEIPTIFLTGHGDIPMAVNCIKRGAAHFLQKPYRPQDLLDAVQEAIAMDRADREARRALNRARQSATRLTPREKEVMGLLATGLTSNDIANKLDLSAKTVRIHRSRIMSKMEADTVVQLAEQFRRLKENERGPDAPARE